MKTLGIIYLTRSLEFGGAERQLVNLAVGLHEKGHQVAVVVFYPRGPLEKELRDAGVTVHHLDKRGRWDIFGFLMRFLRLLRSLRPDILHAFLPLVNCIALLMRSLLPGSHIVKGIRSSNVDLSYYEWLSRLTYWLESRLCRFADLIIINSYAGMEHYTNSGYPAEKMRVIPNGVDHQGFAPDRDARMRVRDEWGVPPETRLIGLVGRFDPLKDHFTFLQAAALIAAEVSSVSFAFIGGGPAKYEAELRKQANALGLGSHLVWAGERSDMADVYNALDIAVCSSVSEGFPNVVAEAMACGVPCVVTDVGDSGRIVGDTGLVVPPRDPGTLAHGWRAMLDQLSAEGEALGAAARAQIVNKFSIEALVSRNEEAFARLLT